MTLPDESVALTSVCVECKRMASETEKYDEKYDVQDKRLQSANKTTVCLLICNGVLFGLTLAACITTAILYSNVTSELRTLKEIQNNDYVDDYEGYSEGLVSNGYDYSDILADLNQNDDPDLDASRVRNDRGKGSRNKGSKRKGKCGCSTRKIAKIVKALLEKQEPSPKASSEKPKSTTPVPMENPSKISPFKAMAHYTTSIDPEYILKLMGPSDDGNIDKTVMSKHMKEFSGILHRNRSLEIQEAPVTLKFLEEAPWMKDIQGTEQLFTQEPGGKFRARFTGLYHIYAHVKVYLDDMSNISVALLHHSNNMKSVVLRCLRTTDSRLPEWPGFDVWDNSCSMSGELQVRADDVFSIDVIDFGKRPPSLDLTRNATYFGGWLIKEW